jgi:zinc finger protein
MSCQEQGTTRFLFTKIPFFKGMISIVLILFLEIIVSSFQCELCGYRNNEVSFSGQIADFGIRYELKVISPVHMNRNVVKSEAAIIRIPELDLEIPPQTQKGTINTIEGFLNKTIEGLNDLQEDRRKYDPATAAKIDEFIQRIQEFMDGRRFPFTFILEDPSGNSFI